MISLYTAIGTYKLDINGRPSIISGDQEYILDPYELILWSTLAFQILNYKELKDMFCKQLEELHITNERGFDYYLHRMQNRNLIACGSNYAGVEALYNLLSKLHIELLPNNFPTKILTFFKLLLRNIPLKTALTVFHKEKFTSTENWVLSMLTYQSLTTAELIMCREKSITKLCNNEQLVDTLYSDEYTDCDSIILNCSLSESRNEIIAAVANLYLKQRINFYLV